MSENEFLSAERGAEKTAPKQVVVEANTPRFWMEMRHLIFPADRIDQADQEVEETMSLLGVPEPCKVLDVGCGIGRHSWALARRGNVVTGIDQVEGYIKEAAQKSSRVGHIPHFISDDVAYTDRLPVAEFDAALCLYHSIGYGPDAGSDILFLKKIHDVLKPGGKAILELLDPAGFVPSERREHHFTTLQGSYERIIEINENCDEYQITFIPDSSPELHFRANHRLFSKEKIKKMLFEVGFKNVSVALPLASEYANASKRITVTGER